MPKIDLADRKTSSCDYFWYNCLNLIDVAAVDFRPVTSLANAFENCTRLLSVDIDISECDSLAKTFYYCGVRSIKLRSPKVTGVWAAFGFATQLEELEMDYGMVGNNASIFINDIKLTRMTLRDFGKAKGLTAFNITAAPWGQGTEAARQTLVDTLLNLSADRVADGNPTCTVTLAAASLAALTDEEIAAITAKGYTLTA
jgi:hypothetical protein